MPTPDLTLVPALSRQTGLSARQIENTLTLLEEGATVPFIARYRKERTGSLDETRIRDLDRLYRALRELEARRGVVLETIRGQGRLDAELEAKIRAAATRTGLEDLYLPYRPRRSTRADRAREAGLEPLARWLAETDDPRADPPAAAARYVDPGKGVGSAGEALAGAADILAEELAHRAEVRARLRQLAREEGWLAGRVRREWAGKRSKFEDYYDCRERVARLPSHRWLAMARGEREEVLRLSLELPEEKALAFLESRLLNHPKSGAAPLLREAARDSLQRLLAPAVEGDVRRALQEAAEEEARRVFASNLEALLLAPPAGRKAVLGVDPGFRTGCKLAAVDGTGRFLEATTIHPHESAARAEEAAARLTQVVRRHGIRLIAVGSGTGGRETLSFIREKLGAGGASSAANADSAAGASGSTGAPAAEHTPPEICLVSEAGASVYSASEAARREFPDLDVTVRGAISIARRLQDPLAELVKIEPRSIGVGQYQHDVEPERLDAALREVVESCVNRVGVDVNLASRELLRHVSGLNAALAERIVRRREEAGPLRSRAELREIPGLGAKTFQQAAGFLRVSGSDHPLDASAVHPEHYGFVEKLARALGLPLPALVGDRETLRAVDVGRVAPALFAGEEVGPETLRDILAELEKPGRDPRAEFRQAALSDSVHTLEDLKPGMALEGTVTNVTRFGAFVDVGVHQDGLVHVSELADRFVRDPREVVKTGQIVQVKVLEVDLERRRVALSMRRLS